MQDLKSEILHLLWSHNQDLNFGQICAVTDAVMNAAEDTARQFRRLAPKDKQLSGAVREALEMLDRHAPGQAREVLMEALK